MRSISQKIFIILIKVLEALNDRELNEKLDKIIAGRLQVFKKGEDRQQQVEQLDKDNQINSNTTYKMNKEAGEGGEDGE